MPRCYICEELMIDDENADLLEVPTPEGTAYRYYQPDCKAYTEFDAEADAERAYTPNGNY